MRPGFVLVAALAVALAGTACRRHNTCAALAERVCRDRGENHPECIGRREEARNPTDGMLARCAEESRPQNYEPMLRAKRQLEKALETPGTADAGTEETRSTP